LRLCRCQVSPREDWEQLVWARESFRLRSSPWGSRIPRPLLASCRPVVSDCSAACATSVHCTLFAPAFCSAAFAAISERSASSIAFLGCAWSAARDFARSSRWRSISCCRASRAARKRSSSASFSPCLRSCLILCRDLGVASWCWASVACVAGLATLGAGSCPASLGCPVLGAASIVASVSRSFACVCAAVILSVSLRRFCCQNLRRLLYALLLAPIFHQERARRWQV